MEHFDNFVHNIGLSFIADAVICLLTLIFFIVILAKKRNVRLLVVSVLYIGAFATTSVFCELTDGKMFFIASTVLRYMLIIDMRRLLL